jgi:uncharacterized protein YrrD
MKVELDAKVRTSDGSDAGTIQRAVFDPGSNEVKAFLVRTGGLLGHEVIVRREQIGELTPDGALRLTMTKDQFDRLEPYVPTAYTAPPLGWLPPTDLPYPPTGFLWPAGTAPVLTQAPSDRAAELDLAPSVEKGMTVRDRDGEEIGVLEEIRYAEGSTPAGGGSPGEGERPGEIRGLVVRLRAGIQTIVGGGTEVEIERGAVARVADRAVHLRIHRSELEARREEAGR